MAKKCKYYIDIYKSESALRKLRKFHVLKVFNLRRVQACTVYMLSLLICTHHACHTCRDGDYCSKQRLGTSYAIIATYHGSVKKWNVFIYSESIFPVQLGCYGYGSHCKSVLLCKHDCHFVSGINQSNFCIFFLFLSNSWYFLLYDYWPVIYLVILRFILFSVRTPPFPPQF